MQEQVRQPRGEVFGDFDDFKVISSNKAVEKIDKHEMFDEQFLDFMQWFKKDIHARYTKKDFQKIQLRAAIDVAVGYAFGLGSYIFLHAKYPQYALLWGIPLFLVSLWIGTRGEVIHMRSHSPNNLTGVQWVDRAIDYLGLAVGGISINLFSRKHHADHYYNGIGLMTKIFSKVHIDKFKVPDLFLVRPFALISLWRDTKFCKAERINRDMLLVEMIFFYIYLVALPTELCFGSYFLLVFHLLPGLFIATCQYLGALLVHSGQDKRNTWESNGLLDWRTAKGLFRVPLFAYGLLNNGFFMNHGIHHAYPQVPLEYINAEYPRYHQHILKTYKNVRHNILINHRIHANLFARLGPPSFFDYVVAVLLLPIPFMLMLLTLMGLPLSPPRFEPLLIDWRVYFVSTRRERAANRVIFFENVMQIEALYRSVEHPTKLQQFVYNNYQRMKKYAAEA